MQAASSQSTALSKGALRFRLIAAWCVFFLVEIAAVITLGHLNYSDDLTATFAGETDAYTRFQSVSETFSQADTDAVILFQSPSFADPANSDVVDEFLAEAQFLPGVMAVFSPLSLKAPDGTLLFAPGQDTQTQTARLKAEFARDPDLANLVSPDFHYLQARLLVDESTLDAADRKAYVAGFRQLANDLEAASDVTISLTGLPFIRDTVAQRLNADFVKLGALGILAGLMVSCLALGSITLSILIAVIAQTVRLWTVAGMTLLGFEINPISITLPTLILVLAFAEAIHLCLALQRCVQEGEARPVLKALRMIMPGTILAAMTTGIAFAALYYTPSDPVQELAIFGSAAIAVSAFFVYMIFALFAVTLLHVFGDKPFRAKPGLVNKLTKSAPSLTQFVARRAPVIALTGLAMVVVSLFGYLQIEPDFDLFEGLQPYDEEFIALTQIDETFAPITSLQFTHPIEPPDAFIAAHEALAKISPSGTLVSLASIPGALDASGAFDPSTIPQVVKSRIASVDNSTGLLSMPFPYEGSIQAQASLDTIAQKIAADPALSALSPPSGLAHVATVASTEILRAFSLCFIIAAVLVGAVVAVWLRSPILGLLTVIPSILPITIVGTVIWVTDIPYTFATGIALTIAFGIAVDDTVHLINRIRQHARSAGQMSEAAILRGLSAILPTLATTSLVLAAGLGVTIFAASPSLLDFGLLCILIFALAFVSDTLLLPSLLLMGSRLKRGRKDRPEPPQ